MANKKSTKHVRILLLKSQVSFKIIVTGLDKVDKFPEVFELGLPEYAYSAVVLMRLEL